MFCLECDCPSRNGCKNHVVEDLNVWWKETLCSLEMKLGDINQHYMEMLPLLAPHRMMWRLTGMKLTLRSDRLVSTMGKLRTIRVDAVGGQKLLDAVRVLKKVRCDIHVLGSDIDQLFREGLKRIVALEGKRSASDQNGAKQVWSETNAPLRSTCHDIASSSALPWLDIIMC